MHDKAKPMESAFHLLHRASQRATEVFATNADGKEITPRQYAVLAAISGKTLPHQIDLVDITGVDRSTLADIVRRLARRGLVRRRRTREDARAYKLSLTAKGDAELQNTLATARATDATLLSALSDAEREVFLSALTKIVNATESSE